jgi:hypothetical protein
MICMEYIPQFFQGYSGALYLLNNLKSSVEAVTVWGDDIQSESSFAPNDCWSMRRSQTYQGNSSKPGLNCKHIKKHLLGATLKSQ